MGANLRKLIFTILVIQAGSAFCQPFQSISINLDVERDDSISLEYSLKELNKSFKSEKKALYSNQLNYIIFEIPQKQELLDFNLVFDQIPKTNNVSIYKIKVSLKNSIIIFDHMNLPRVFNPNYFITNVSVTDSTTNYKLLRFWNAQAKLRLNDNMNVILKDRNFIKIQMHLSTRRQIFSACYYNEGKGIQRQFASSEEFKYLEFELYSYESFSNLNIFMGDHENLITIRKIIINHNGLEQVFIGQEILDNFQFNEYLIPNITSDSILVFAVKKYQNKASPYLYYNFFDNESLSNNYSVIIGLNKLSLDDRFQIEVYDNRKQQLYFKRKLVFSSDTAFQINFDFKTRTELDNFIVYFGNRDNIYDLESIEIAENNRKRLYLKDEIFDYFEFHHLDKLKEGKPVFKPQQSSGGPGIYFEGPLITRQEEIITRMKEILKILLVAPVLILLNVKLLNPNIKIFEGF